MADNDIDYGPLTGLIGTWQGDKGHGCGARTRWQEESPYFETITFTPIGDVTNAEEQVLVGLRYQQVVSHLDQNNKVFSRPDCGYWMWIRPQAPFHSLFDSACSRGDCRRCSKTEAVSGHLLFRGEGRLTATRTGASCSSLCGTRHKRWHSMPSSLSRVMSRSLHLETTVLDIHGKEIPAPMGTPFRRVN